MRKANKNIITLSVVLIAGLNFIVPAFAADPFGATAGIGFAFGQASGINIGIASAGSASQANTWYNGASNSDPVTISNAVDFDWTSGDVPIYKNENDKVIAQINSDSALYELFNNTQNSGYTQTIASKLSITDYSSGTSTERQYQGYYFNRTTNTSFYIGPFIGNMTSGASYYIGDIHIYQEGTTVTIEVNGNVVYTQANNPDRYNISLGNNKSNPSNYRFVTSGGSGLYQSFTAGSADSQTIPWSSGKIDYGAGHDFIHIEIPTTYLQYFTPSSGVNDFTKQDLSNFFKDLTSNAVDLSKVGDIKSEYTNDDIGGDVPPVPPTPVPSTPLGEVPFDDWVDLWGQGIYQQLENQSDALDFIGSNGEDAVEELESIDSNLDDLNETAESIDTNIDTGIGLLGGIKSAVESGVDFLEGIAEHVEELVEEIVEGTETLIAGILNQIPSVFGVIFGPIKQASSIWHYVVEWIQSITAPMTWMLTMASGTSYYIILPVYASLAGAVVLAFYKRFGK